MAVWGGGPRMYSAAVALQRPLARGAHEPAILLAFQAHAVEELLPDRRVVAVAHRRHKASAVVAEVLDGLLARHVPLVRHEDQEDEDEDADDDRDGEALEAPALRSLKGEGGRRNAHGPESREARLRIRRADPSALGGTSLNLWCSVSRVWRGRIRAVSSLASGFARARAAASTSSWTDGSPPDR